MSDKPVNQAPLLWAIHEWPAWVPELLRVAVQYDYLGRAEGPEKWLESCSNNGCPPFGTEIGMEEPYHGHSAILLPSDPDCVLVGRYVHKWSNLGCLVLPDGTTRAVYTLWRWASLIAEFAPAGGQG